MYHPTFRDPPELCAAIREMGPKAFLETLLKAQPDASAYLDDLAPDMKVGVTDHIVSQIETCFADNVRAMKPLYYSMMRQVSIKGSNTNSISRSTVGRKDEFFIRLSRMIMMLDHGSPDTARQVRDRSVEWEALGRNLTSILRLDPRFSAFAIVNRICLLTDANLKVTALIEASIGRIIEKQGRRDASWGYGREYAFVHHVVDWFKSAIRDNEAWLSNVDHLKRPKKLLKFGSFEALAEEADRQLARRLAKQRRQPLSELDESVVTEGSGFRIVRLLTRKALEEESRAMRHCIARCL